VKRATGGLGGWPPKDEFSNGSAPHELFETKSAACLYGSLIYAGTRSLLNDHGLAMGWKQSREAWRSSR
jgi:hypothetical protein